MNKSIISVITILLLSVFSVAHASANTLVTSPDKKLSVVYNDKSLNVFYDNNTKVLCLTGIDLDTNASHPVSDVQKVVADYKMLTGKRLVCRNEGNEVIIKTTDGRQMYIRCYNDGVAVRNVYPSSGFAYADTLTVNCQNRWLMKYSEAYEDFFPINPEIKDGAHWGFPSLFEINKNVFLLITEADIQKGNSGASLYSLADKNTFRIDHPQDINPVSPWRVFMIGQLSDIVESTLVTDLSEPNKLQDTTWIHPGVVSWVYWAYNHGSNDYNIIKQYSDMARDLHLPYVLIDAEWDEMKDGKTMEDAVRYALSQGVKPMIWYNSSVGWINGAPGPKFRLNKPEDREKEFAYIEKLGVAGVKIDFFAGDIQSTMDYHQDLLECAARHHLLVNFHGATIPRGWQRTWPNLMSTEAVYGAEWYNNLPFLTKKAACHNATLPFTRGVIGSMDYTPCTFTDSQHPHITTDGHELALTVLFESGLLHLADRPTSYLSQPQVVKDFLSSLPSTWDDTKLLAGYPGDFVIMARKKADVWYIAGINGHDEDLVVSKSDFRLNVLPKKLQKLMPRSISFKPRGGFVMVFKDKKLNTILSE